MKEIGLIENPPLLEGRNMTMVLGPTKNAGAKPEHAEAEDTLKSEEEVQGDGNGEAAAPKPDVGPHGAPVAEAEAGFRKDQPVAAANTKMVNRLLGRR